MRLPLLRGLDDVVRTFHRLPILFYFTWTDTKARYIRSVLGPFWLVLGTAISVLGLGALWTSLLGMDAHEYFPSLAIGLVVWQWVAACLGEASGALVRKSNVLRNMEMPVTFFCIGPVISQSITFLHNLVIVALVLLIFPQPSTPTDGLLSLLGVLLTVANLLWIVALLAITGARFRDLEPAVTSVLPILFLLSPVLFQVRHLPFNPTIIWLNPISYAITAIRDPLLGAPPGATIYCVLSVSAAVGWMMTILAIGHHRKRIPFWV